MRFGTSNYKPTTVFYPMLPGITAQLNRGKIIRQMAAGKKRIISYPENPQQGVPAGVKFIKPFTLLSTK